MHVALMTGDAPAINESGHVQPVNYIKVHAFLARGTCLFFPPCPSCFFHFYLLLPPSSASSLFFLPPAPASFAGIIPVVARIISVVVYHIWPRLRARLFGSTKRDLSWCIIIGAKGRFRIYLFTTPCRFAAEFARISERFCVFTWVF